MDLGKTSSRNNDLLTVFVIGFFRTSRQFFASHVDIGSTVQIALDELYNNCLISVSIKGSNASTKEIQEYHVISWKGTNYVYLIFSDSRSC